MEINVLDQIRETAQAFGVNCAILNENSNWEYEWDSRLYKALGKKLIYDENIANALQLCKEGSMYVVRDRYDTIMITFMYEKQLIAIGPFIAESTEEIMSYVTEKNHIPEEYHEEIREIYNSYPWIRNMDVLEDLILMNMKYLFPGKTMEKVHLSNIKYPTKMFDEIKQMEDNRLSMEAIEARYKVEERFMRAVASGNYEKVIEITNEFKKYRMSPRSKDALRDSKNKLVILNTLLRRAVQNAQVHPAHIDRVSARFANRIEVATKNQEITEIAREMPKKYCQLVDHYSLEGYSDLLRDTLNYVDFNLTEDLSLNAISERFSVNASYLSKQFKKETGKTLTDYVNEKRIKTSLKYLATTDYPVQNIAEMVGIYDENYYSRLFRKYEDMTPTRYRKLQKNE